MKFYIKISFYHTLHRHCSYPLFHELFLYEFSQIQSTPDLRTASGPENAVLKSGQQKFSKKSANQAFDAKKSANQAFDAKKSASL
jgi:hypothetical protein